MKVGFINGLVIEITSSLVDCDVIISVRHSPLLWFGSCRKERLWVLRDKGSSLASQFMAK